ncbi:MAG: hypothetical protein IT432_08220 [Phycisphaerales bacterium]|nr:hypothetical protein [Phycisphaerales bacterium]
MNQELAKVIEALLRRIPDKWQRVDTEQLSVTEQQTLLRLVAAGLVERRNTLRLDMAGQNESFEATIAVTGEAGLLMAIEPVLAESWSRWSGAIEDWRRRTGAASRPFRVTKVGGDEWRLTENGLLARADLSVPLDSKLSREHASVIASRERVIDFVMKAGALEDRPPVHGAGQLVSFRSVAAEKATPQTTHVNLTNAADIAAAFREAMLPLVEAVVGGGARVNGRSSASTAPQAGSMSWQDAMRHAEEHVKKHGGFFPGRNELASIVGCSPATMTKVLKHSPYLKARRAESAGAAKGKEVGSSDNLGNTQADAKSAREALDDRIDAGETHPPVDAYHAGDDEAPADRDETIANLIAEQQAERTREERQRRSGKKRPER